MGLTFFEKLAISSEEGGPFNEKHIPCVNVIWVEHVHKAICVCQALEIWTVLVISF